MNKPNSTDILLKRTTLNKSSFNLFLSELVETYPELEEIKNVSPIIQGYEDANFCIDSTNGKFVLKIFAEDMSVMSVKAHVQILHTAKQMGVPVLSILQNKKGELFSCILNNFCFITKYVEAISFKEKKPDYEDMLQVSAALAKLNSINTDLTVSYDSWGNAELLWEYKRSKENTPSKTLKLIMPTIDKLRMLNMDGFTKGIVHGDIQPNHVFKLKNGRCLIIDFGVARHDYLVYEISTFLAWFCLPEYDTKDYSKIINLVLEEYEKHMVVSKDEKIALPLLIEAAYVAYHLRTSILLANRSDKETVEWNKKSRSLLLRWRDFLKNTSDSILVEESCIPSEH